MPTAAAMFTSMLKQCVVWHLFSFSLPT